MAKTSTERSKLCRKKLREDAEKYSAFKAKDKERKRNERSKKKPLSESELENLRQKTRERKRKSRMKKKTQKESCNVDNEENVHAYVTPQALGKAVGKVKSRLPKSPRKRKAVITKLATTSGLVIAKRKKGNSGGNKKLTAATITKVKEFFCKDYVSRQAPGKKDYVIQRQSGKKEYLQKRHLMFSLKEAHSLFQKEHPAVKIGLSTFSSLRPENVLLSSDTPRNVCLCQYHENIRLICDCLSKEVEGFPSYSGNFVDKFACDSSSEECMLGRCQTCMTYTWLDEIMESAESSLCEQVTWNQWERVEVAVPTKKNKPPKVVKKMKKVYKEGTIEDVFVSLRSKMPNFLEHVFVKRKQSSYFEEKKSNLQQGEAVVQVDFAENYSCQHRDEIQAAHWNQQQITLFTVAVWTRNESKDITCESHVIVSDDLEHEKTSVAVFISTVLETFVKQKHPEVTKAYIFSDGPSSQFKNKYIVSILSKLAKIVHVQWNYFATSHGKGAVDGIGGTIKRLVWNAVATRRAPPVTDAKSFHEVATTLNSSVSVHLMKKKEIKDRATSLGLSKSFKEAVALPGISKFHCIEPQINGFVQSKMYSTQSMVEKEMVPRVFPFDLEESGSDSDEADVSYTEVESNDIDHDNIAGSDLSNDADSNEDLVHEISDISNKDTEKECQNNASEEELFNSIDITIDHGLPPYMPIKFDSIHSPYNVPLHTSCLVDGILSGHIKFQGNGIIDDHDLKSLIGGHRNSQENYLTNFVIDEYLTILKATAKKVSVIPWEVFEKFVVKRIFAENENLLNQDLILVPCNSENSKHWYLLVAFPQLKTIAVLDSIAGDFVKPNAEVCIKKMWVLLKMFDSTLDEKEWHFVDNTPDDLPQQDNDFDCGVFVTLYARCLITNSTMFVEMASLGNFRKHMVAELHKQSLIAISSNIVTGKYYAVDYVNKFYIGRALETDDKVTKFQFLHAAAKMFDWPRSNDIESKHSSCVFYGPITLLGNRPFEVAELKEIETLFKNIIRKAN